MSALKEKTPVSYPVSHMGEGQDEGIPVAIFLSRILAFQDSGNYQPFAGLIFEIRPVLAGKCSLTSRLEFVTTISGSTKIFNPMKPNALATVLLVLGAATAQSQYIPSLPPQELSKPWTLSGDVRGFYDDNYRTLPGSSPSTTGTGVSHPAASWGEDFTGLGSINHTTEDTSIGGSYIFDARHYEKYDLLDYTHQAGAHFEHEFSTHFKLSASDSFVDAQEPTIIDPGVISDPFVVPGNNLRNTGRIDFTGTITKDFDLHLGYANTFYSYQQTARSVIGYGFDTGNPDAGGATYLARPSNSALLDRMEQLATVDLRWKATTQTTGVLGYQFGHTDYTAPEYIIFPYPPYNVGPGGPAAEQGFLSNIRNLDSHCAYLGVDENFATNLTASLRAGAEYVDYYIFHDSRVSPYVDASIAYQYLPDDSARVGVKHVHNATDVVGEPGTLPVLDEQTTAVFASESHTFSHKFDITFTGQYQHSEFVGGGPGFDGKGQDFFVAQVSFAYHFTPWLLAETGYNYSRLKSDFAGREYARDFGFLGLRTTW
jgi:hypothetical protein